MERRKNKRMSFSSKWDKKRIPLKGAKLKRLRQLWVRGSAWNASLEELGLNNILTA